jgi:hypothetical protein
VSEHRDPSLGRYTIGPNLDPFRERQARDVLSRFTREQAWHRRQADLMWAGVMVVMFSDHELRLIDDCGFLSQLDRDLLKQAGRDVTADRTPAPADMPAPLVPHKPKKG